MQAIAYMEPVSFDVQEPQPYLVPAIMYGAALAEWQCSIPGLDFLQFYTMWQCPKVLIEVAVGIPIYHEFCSWWLNCKLDLFQQ